MIQVQTNDLLFLEKSIVTIAILRKFMGIISIPRGIIFGSETLYLKLLFCDYEEKYVIIEFIGEWNDAITNDIMLLKRNIIDVLLTEGINKFIMIGENVLNFHGSDDSYYEEWLEEVEEGWIACVSFPEFLREEMVKYNLDAYLNMGELLEIKNGEPYYPAPSMY